MLGPKERRSSMRGDKASLFSEERRPEGHTSGALPGKVMDGSCVPTCAFGPGHHPRGTLIWESLTKGQPFLAK